MTRPQRKRSSKPPLHITVHAIHREPPDLDRFRRALLEMAFDMVQRGETNEEYAARNQREREASSRQPDKLDPPDLAA